MDKKYQVFISSTFKDLTDERDVVIKAILELLHIPIGMEMFSAEDEEQWQIIKRTIDSSDYYILILGLRYGAITSEGISFTQKEYEYALEKKIPIMAFLMNEDVSLAQQKRDDDLTKIKSFRNSVLGNTRMASFWSSKEELVSKVSISFIKQTAQKPGIGWVRGDSISIDENSIKELSTLSKENRELRNKVEQLENLTKQVKPKLKANVRCLGNVEFKHKYNPLIKPEPINYNELDDKTKEYVSIEEINSYNRSLPDDNEIIYYNRNMEMFERIEADSCKIEIDVSNVGESKANNVYIDITFPDSLIVSYAEQENNIPKKIIPESPLIKAERNRQLQAFGKIFGNINTHNRASATLVRNINPLTPSIIGSLNKNKTHRVNRNTITLSLKELLHTRGTTFEEFKITPVKSGPYEITIDIFCEEYKESELIKQEI